MPYDEQDIKEILEIVAENPAGFLQLAKRLKIATTQEEIRNSMRAWKINPNDRLVLRSNGHSLDCICTMCTRPSHTYKNDKSSSHRPSRLG